MDRILWHFNFQRKKCVKCSESLQIKAKLVDLKWWKIWNNIKSQNSIISCKLPWSTVSPWITVISWTFSGCETISNTKITSPEKKYKIAYIREALESEGLDPEIKAQTEALIERLKNEGHEITVVDFPFLEYVVPCYYILTTAEASSNLSRFDSDDKPCSRDQAWRVLLLFRKAQPIGQPLYLW